MVLIQNDFSHIFFTAPRLETHSKWPRTVLFRPAHVNGAPEHKGRAGLFIWTLPGRGVRSIAKGQTDANGSQEAIRID